MKTFLMSLAMVGVMAGPALAFQCPSLIKQINDATANRLDNGANEAKTLIRDAEQLHKDGKHAEAVAKAEQAAKVAGINLVMKK